MTFRSNVAIVCGLGCSSVRARKFSARTSRSVVQIYTLIGGAWRKNNALRLHIGGRGVELLGSPLYLHGEPVCTGENGHEKVFFCTCGGDLVDHRRRLPLLQLVPPRTAMRRPGRCRSAGVRRRWRRRLQRPLRGASRDSVRPAHLRPSAGLIRPRDLPGLPSPSRRVCVHSFRAHLPPRTSRHPERGIRGGVALRLVSRRRRHLFRPARSLYFCQERGHGPRHSSFPPGSSSVCDSERIAGDARGAAGVKVARPVAPRCGGRVDRRGCFPG